MAEQRKSFFDRLRETASSRIRELRGAAIVRARDIARSLFGKNISGNELMHDRKRLKTRLQPIHLGKLTMFFYNPKYKETLPYYDRFPLIIPLELYNDGFLGLNLHYLPPELRARLMDLLYDQIYKETDGSKIDDKRRIRITYDMVKNISKNRLFVPCIKRYLYQHLVSKLYVLKPEDWDIALYLPTERFEKATKRTVWNESRQKIRNR